jgi:hypothetical protein
MNPNKYPAFTASVSAFSGLLLAIASVVVVAAVSSSDPIKSITTRPSPKLTPSEVVRIQVDALRHNTVLNEGIALTFRFASPDNKQVTGPLPRFTEMLRSDPYDRLLNHRRARYGPIAIAANQAYQTVTITDAVGERIDYHWVLTRQTTGEYEGCWMTNAVIPAKQPTQRQLTQILPWNPL